MSNRSIDTAHLLAGLPKQRWFGSKERPISSLEMVDSCTPQEDDPRLIFALVKVHFADGGSDYYHLPLLVDEDASARDAFENPESLRGLGVLMAHGDSCDGEHGQFRFGGAGLDPSAPPGGGSARSIGAEQSNTSLVLDESVIVKLFRRVEPGPNPELELNRTLTNEGFNYVPAQVGEITYVGKLAGEATTIDLGIAQQFVTDGVDGWDETLAHLRDFCDWAEGAGDQGSDRALLRAAEDRLEPWLLTVEELGDVTASLHVTLAREGLEQDFAPEPFGTGDLKLSADSTVISMQRLLQAGVTELEDLREPIEERIERLAAVIDAGLRTRVHGDYHLGQTMYTPRGWLLLDFEGEPARRLGERRAKRSPLRDVAGMLRSFSYAAFAVLFERDQPEGIRWNRLRPFTGAWEQLCRQRFLAAYLRTSHEGRFLPPDRDDLAAMLDMFEIDKALYELAYERGHRPEWTRIPLAGIAEVVARSERR